MTPLEKMARAIDENCYEEGERWRACLPKMARAALEALRIPSAGMLAAADKAQERASGDWLAPDHAWTVMLDAALSETEETKVGQ